MVEGKPLAWDVPVPDTYADAHVSNTAMKTGAAASLAATNKANTCSQLSETRIFTPVAISGVDPYGTGGTCPPQYLLWGGDMPMNVPPPISGSFVLETSIFSRHLIARSPSVCSNQHRLTAAAAYFLSEKL